MAYIRALHGVINFPPVDILLDGNKIVLNLEYTNITSFLKVKSGNVNIEVIPSGDSPSGNSTKNYRLREGAKYTLELLGSSNGQIQLNIRLVENDNVCQKPGTSKLTFINGFAIQNVKLALNSNGVIVTPELSFSEYRELYMSDLSRKELTVVQGNNVVGQPIWLYPYSGGDFSYYFLGGINSSTGTIETYSLIVKNHPQFYCDCLENNLSVQNYMGQWYQISGIPQFFDTNCGQSGAQYTYLSDRIFVKNTCYDDEWNPISAITGFAFNENPCIPAALNVLFEGFPESPTPNYLIHATDYKVYSVVGSSDRKSLFILSRNKSMSYSNYMKLVKFAQSLGYDVSKLKVNDGAVTK